MKTLTKMLAAMTAIALFAGCVNEEPPYKKNTEPEEPVGQATGFLTGAMDLRVIFDAQTDTRPDDTEDETQRPTAKSTRTAPDTDGYTVEIFDAEDVSVYQSTYGELRAALQEKPLELPVGSYRMEICSADPAALQPVAWDKPVYGTSHAFTILKNKPTTIDKVVCTLQNIKVTLLCAVDLAEQLSKNTAATVTIGSARTTFEIGETRAAFFLSEAEENTLDFRLEGEFVEGGAVKFSKQIKGVRAGQWRKITLVIDYADKGNAKFDIVVDSFILDETITVNGTENLWEPVYEEAPLVEAPTLGWTGHEFGTPFRLKASLFDENNLCSEPFEIGVAAPGRVASFEVAITSTSPEFLTALGDTGIPAAFDLCTVSGAPAALLQGFGFPVGDDVLHAAEKTFYIGGQLPWLLYGFDGTHTFAFTVTDAEGQTAQASLVLTVDRNNETNEGPTIVMAGHDIAQPYVLEAAEDVIIDIEAPEGGIQALRVRIESEALVPLLEAVSMSSLLEWFDLCTVNQDQAEFLGSFVGFPVLDQVKDRTAVTFPVGATFVGILKDLDPSTPGVPNTYKFHLEVIDNAGGKTAAVLTMVQPATTKQ
ncbi:DUF4493 domain-containing protein [Alistipes sp.]|uniref:DUF4493 domain-containing protein n=1 Tax=Alistipes sp. TaxID=1872444 RepID=UPI003AEF5E39